MMECENWNSIALWIQIHIYTLTVCKWSTLNAENCQPSLEIHFKNILNFDFVESLFLVPFTPLICISVCKNMPGFLCFTCISLQFLILFQFFAIWCVYVRKEKQNPASGLDPNGKNISCVSFHFMCFFAVQTYNLDMPKTCFLLT